LNKTVKLLEGERSWAETCVSGTVWMLY